MDVRLHGNSQLQYGVNGRRSSRPGEDESLQSLSQEEQECLQFFEQTIDSLEESLEEDDRRQARPPEIHEVDRPVASSPRVGFTMSPNLNRPPSPKEQDIIDLVRPEPDLMQTREPVSSPTNPDFHSMMLNPESHFEIKPRRDPSDSLPSEYNPPLPSGSFGSTDSSYHPPGCIPTPVLIAQKIAENQAGGNSSNLLPSTRLRRLSLESEKPADYSTDPPAKQGPPTSTKPARFPSNISVILSNKEHQNQSLANVNIHERRAQMLANLSGTSHPLLQENSQPAEEQKPRNTPTRSISFRDPTPGKSRMEALSKLGLTRNRAMSGGMSLLVSPDSTSLDSLNAAESKPTEPTASPTTRTQEVKTTEVRTPEVKTPEVVAPPPSQIHVDRKPEILRTDSFKSHEERRNLQPSPSPLAVTQTSYFPPPLDRKLSISPPPEVTTPEFNSYGGKSIVVNPSFSRNEPPATSPTSPEPRTLPPALSNPTEFNSYGGKSKVLTPAPAAVTKSDLPDILSSHIDTTQSLPAKPEPIELNSYGGKSRAINPTTGPTRPPETPVKTYKPPAPTPAPRPPRLSYHGALSSQKAASRALSPDHKRRSNSMFRPQGITVQFSGRGATNESRREALRKLGLLKDS
ncbi:proline and serine-rich protein 2 [Acanthochromis polyacanthus]|uniref:proline and serine-rich protein 2 n=1 Tax=Acanthochromis polyacanthus TaxID=80966 RepID=UPI002234A97E|nr:proline and serine-rich protein 2 [Acanthochromis polyacanthus]